eukprot:CAMPEP_0194130976 /NCGR_PEP_ID=MMETSP0152-20130528/1852_1 /TAXON_ID=1049557 /ORGANISM="Thalassiothrix antarctica, Strain L6-D1" /LENGTH=199 /DNA_ID=CAMNT_0038825623 /DNA_START=74 /DNA_END=673 /DNA_ORIENTATION=+
MMFSRLTVLIFSAALSVAAPHYHHGGDGDHKGDWMKDHHWGEGKRGGRGGRSGVGSEEKGSRCAAAKNSTFNSHLECEGGMKKEFDADVHPHSIAANMVGSAQEYLQQNFIPDVQHLTPSHGKMGELLELEGEDALLEGESKTVEFGGEIKTFWGCNVTFSMEDGKRSKVSQCGFKTEAHMGSKKDPEEDNEFKVEVKD